MSKSRNIADLGSNDVLETDANGVTVTGGVASDTLNVDSGTLFVDGDNNRVGVGTSSPDETAHIKNTQSTSWNTMILENETPGDGSLLVFKTDSTPSGGYSIGPRGSQDALSFLRGGTESARIDANGNVGIGTTSPSEKLEVNGNIIADGVYLGGTGSANKLDDYEEGTWTPSIDGINFSTIKGVYKKIGSIVYVSFRLDGGSGSANIPEIDGLPFTASSQLQFASNGNYIGEVGGAVSGVDYYTRIQNGGNTIRILKRDGSSHRSVLLNEVPTQTIRLSITYITDS